MTTAQICFTVLLSALLLVVGGYYAWRQLQCLRGLRADETLPPEDRRYVHRQAWRRLICSGLMVALAAMLAGSLFFEAQAEELAQQRAANPDAELDPAQRQFGKQYGYYWITALLLLLGMVSLALYDFLAIRRFGQQQYRKIQEDRRAMIESQVARLRQQRNGHN
jgi:uncharacterized membrane protein